MLGASEYGKIKQAQSPLAIMARFVSLFFFLSNFRRLDLVLRSCYQEYNVRDSGPLRMNEY